MRLSDKEIERRIRRMLKEGCSLEGRHKVLVCGHDFGKRCLRCEVGKKYIGNAENIQRFNKVFYAMK